MNTKPLKYEIGVARVSGSRAYPHVIGEIDAEDLDTTMAALCAVNKLPRPVAVVIGGLAWWIGKGDMLYVVGVQPENA